MSILIKGMEMPTRCMDCPFMVSRDNDDCILQSNEANANFKDWDEMKASCPLIHIPPHGRLIDADAMIRDIERAIVPSRYIKERNADMVNFLSLEDTIIPADESDMDSFIRIFKEDDEEDGMDSFIRIFKD